MKVTAIGTVEKGILKIQNRRVFDADLSKLKGEVRVMVEKTNRKRTNPQNRYYWGVVIPLCKQGFVDIGNEITEEDTHEFLKSRFNPKEITFETTGESFRYGGSTTEFDTVDMMDYIAHIQQFASEYLNLFIPDPIL